MKRFRYTLWDPPDAPPPTNRSHILADHPAAEHPERELLEEDVDDVVLGSRTVVDRDYVRGGERRMDLLGETALGRRLFVTVTPRGEAARPVSARDMTEDEQQRYAWRQRVRRWP